MPKRLANSNVAPPACGEAANALPAAAQQIDFNQCGFAAHMIVM
jgi:hypothetical protein